MSDPDLEGKQAADNSIDSPIKYPLIKTHPGVPSTSGERRGLAGLSLRSHPIACPHRGLPLMPEQGHPTSRNLV